MRRKRDIRHGPLHRPAAWIYRIVSGRRKELAPEIKAALGGIYGEAIAEEKYALYETAKYEKVLTAACLGLTVSLIAAILPLTGGGEDTVTGLKRPANGSHTYMLAAKAGGEKASGIRIEVPVRQLQAAQKQEYLTRAEQELERVMETENAPLDEVSEDLVLPVSLAEGRVEVVWESDHYDLVDTGGHLRNELTAETGEAASLTAILTCGGVSRELIFPIRVVPRNKDLGAQLAREAARKISWETDAEREMESFSLPEEYQGNKLLWHMEKKGYGPTFSIFTVLACLLLNAAYEKDLKEKGKRREESLLTSYPAFLARLTLLAGAGMPIRTAFARMAADGKGPMRETVYGEVLRACREMESGITEEEAYENMGKRCRLIQYRKCASLLSRNIRKGADGLLDALNQEAVNAFEERKALARRKGEEAQTKLLLPMMLMLVVVMILIMAPACFSFTYM